MASNTIYFENPGNGFKKEAPVGFSWTVLFFGFFPPILRSHWSWGLVLLLLTIITAGIAHFVIGIVCSFIYNKAYIKHLISTGYKAKRIDKGSIKEISEELGLTIEEV